MYYWLKLKTDFFRQKEIKKLRNIAGGDTYTVIYLKMLLLSLTSDCTLYFEGIEDDFIDEIALELDEEPDNVRATTVFLINCGLMEEASENEFSLIYAKECTGSETAGAERVRKLRDKQKALHCNATVTKRNALVQKCNTEIEIEIEKEIEIDNKTICPSGDGRFGEFWSEYPKKLAKQDAKKAWKALKVTDSMVVEIIAGLKAWRASDQWQRDQGTYIPYPATFLRGRRWEDVPEQALSEDELRAKELEEYLARRGEDDECTGDS